MVGYYSGFERQTAVRRRASWTHVSRLGQPHASHRRRLATHSRISLTRWGSWAARARGAPGGCGGGEMLVPGQGKRCSLYHSLPPRSTQDQVLGESSMMIGDCTTRMENAFNDLLAAVVRLPPRPLRTTPFPHLDLHPPVPANAIVHFLLGHPPSVDGEMSVRANGRVLGFGQGGGCGECVPGTPGTSSE